METAIVVVIGICVPIIIGTVVFYCLRHKDSDPPDSIWDYLNERLTSRVYDSEYSLV